jgi:hypothetical protein
MLHTWWWSVDSTCVVMAAPSQSNLGCLINACNTVNYASWSSKSNIDSLASGIAE